MDDRRLASRDGHRVGISLLCRQDLPADSTALFGWGDRLAELTDGVSWEIQPEEDETLRSGESSGGGRGVGPAEGSITMVLEAEPDAILLKDATTDNASFVVGNVYDQLTDRDWSCHVTDWRGSTSHFRVTARATQPEIALFPGMISFHLIQS